MSDNGLIHFASLGCACATCLEIRRVRDLVRARDLDDELQRAMNADKTRRYQQMLEQFRKPAPPVAPPTCATCRWYVHADAECHRRAPAANTNPSDRRTRLFPVMQPTDTCGDHQPKETR